MKFTLGNAAGTVSWPAGTTNLRLEEMERLARSVVTHITIGPMTVLPREGNSGETYYYHPRSRWSLNSRGLPSLGMKTFVEVIRTCAAIVRGYGKQLRVTVAGFEPDEYAFLAETAFKAGADAAELNLGCPNVWGEDGTQKPIPSYHPPLVREILRRTAIQLGPGRRVDVKISPVPNAVLNLLATEFDNAPQHIVENVVAVNTLPNRDLPREDGRHALNHSGGNHLGGLAGAPLKEEALRVAKQLRAMLTPSIGVIGVGGIFTGRDALELLKAGVCGLQVGTAFLEAGPRVFSHIVEELSDLPEAEPYFDTCKDGY